MDQSKENTNEIAVKVDGVSKVFKLPHEKHSSVKSMFVNIFKKKKYEKQHALKNVSFEINKGEFFGIVGRNGSGKSTLLKMIAGIYNPTRGTIKVNGSLTPFIELGVGFNPELTGRENVFLNGALLGFNRKEMKALYDEIVEFAELEKFMDQKLKNYSSGMQVRLAFSIAIRAQSDILLLDEVLAVGDESFQRKCFDYFIELKNTGRTVILVTHSMESVLRFCDRAMLVNDGIIIDIGSTEKITQQYEEVNMTLPDKLQEKNKTIQSSEGDIAITIGCMNESGKKVNNYVKSDKIYVDMELTSKVSLKDVFVGVSLHKPGGGMVFLTTTEKPNTNISAIAPGEKIKLTMEVQNIFPEDTYSITLSMKSFDRTKVYLTAKNVTSFRVVNNSRYPASFRPTYKFTHHK